MIDDSQSDMLFAEKLNIQGVFITHSKTRTSSATYICNSLADVPEMLMRINKE